jgi:hypothetical protein
MVVVDDTVKPHVRIVAQSRFLSVASSHSYLVINFSISQGRAWNEAKQDDDYKCRYNAHGQDGDICKSSTPATMAGKWQQ